MLVAMANCEFIVYPTPIIKVIGPAFSPSHITVCEFWQAWLGNLPENCSILCRRRRNSGIFVLCEHNFYATELIFLHGTPVHLPVTPKGDACPPKAPHLDPLPYPMFFKCRGLHFRSDLTIFPQNCVDQGCIFLNLRRLDGLGVL